MSVISRTKRAVVAERRAKLVKLRLEGCPYQDIYAELGYSSRGAASRDFSRILEGYIAEQRTSMEVHREVELMKLDTLTAQATRVLQRTHYMVTQSGRVAEDPDTGAPMLDDQPVLNAIDRLLRIGDRRAKLLGLDAPQRLEVLTIDAIDAQIAALTEQLAATRSEAECTAGTEETAD